MDYRELPEEFLEKMKQFLGEEYPEYLASYEEEDVYKRQGLDLDENEKTMGRVEAIILSMTAEERRNPDLMNPSRKKRIAQGAGVDIAEVNRLVKQFGDMKKLMKQLPGMAGGGKRKGLGGLGGMLGKMKLPF